MFVNNLIRKVAKAILLKPQKKVTLEISSVNYNHILDGHNIVITGGSRGIGLAMAQKFVAEGAKVLITGRNEDSLREALSTIEKKEKISILVHDMEKENDFDGLVEKFYSELGEVTSLVFNAGISLHEGNILNVDQNGYDRQFNTNLRANYFLAQAFLKKKIKMEERGNLLFLSSETAGKSADIPYGLTKTALNSLCHSLARRVYSKGIRVNAIAPGLTYTDMVKGKRVITDDYSNSSVAGRYFLPSEIAEVACFLLSNASLCITGEIIYCDAGSHLKINGYDTEYSF